MSVSRIVMGMAIVMLALVLANPVAGLLRKVGVNV